MELAIQIISGLILVALAVLLIFLIIKLFVPLMKAIVFLIFVALIIVFSIFILNNVFHLGLFNDGIVIANNLAL